MKTRRFDFLFPPEFPGYEQTQKARLLHVMLLVAFLGASIIGLTNFLNDWHTEATYLFGFAGISLLGFYLNRKRYLDIAAFILCASFFVVVCLMLYKGAGLYDETMLAFPAFIIFITFLYDKRGLWIAAFLSVVAAIAIHLLQVYGLFESQYPASPTRLFIVSSLFLLTTLTVWVVHDSWKMNLLHLQQSYALTLQGWARALEYRDGETAGHTRRVSDLSVRLSRKLGLSEEEVRGVEHGAYLHDIGKMAVPDNILLKAGPLTEEEWRVMKQHPVRSRDFISEIPYLRPAIDVAYSHHEHWDGSGYPEGLRGEEIPLTARIFTMVDNWDALNSNRPYRKAWTRGEVVAYLQENAGSIFDPGVVQAFMEILEEDGG